MVIIENQAPGVPAPGWPGTVSDRAKNMNRCKVAIYPGSFDPVTNGHLDIVERASRIFSKVIIAVLRNERKDPFFSVAERTEMLTMAIEPWDNVEVARFDGLLVNFARQMNAGVIIRGLRAVTDFDYEFQLALMNRRLNKEVETIFLMPSAEFSYLSSSQVKEAVALGGSVEGLVPDFVERMILEKIRRTGYKKEQR